MYPTAEISAIKFGIASEEEIIQQSVVHVTSTDASGDNSVYDPRMGPLSNERCKVCFKAANECVGHFGHIKLIEPVVNPLFVVRLCKIANTYCSNCGIAIQKGKTKLLQKFKTCDACQTFQTFISIDKEYSIWENYNATEKKEIFAKVLDQRVAKISLNDLLRDGFQVCPMRMIFKSLPVLPHMNRSSVNQGEARSDDELTMQYLEIIKNNKKLTEAISSEKKDVMKCYQKLVFSINVLINNSKGKAKHPSSSRVIKSCNERIAGKTGLMRSGVQGKRCDKSGRTVSAPGPELNHGEFGIPLACAQILSRVHVCTLFNHQKLQYFCDNGKVNLVERIVTDQLGETKPCKFSPPKFCRVAQTKLEPGDEIIRKPKIEGDGFFPLSGQFQKVEGKWSLVEKVKTGREVLGEGDVIKRIVNNRVIMIEAVPEFTKKFPINIGDRVHVQLQNGDWILVNRQPTLSSGSLQSGRVVIVDGFCCRIPLSSTPQFNMDFDGDEDNVHVPQTEEGMNDLKISDACEQIISASTGEPVVYPVQDSIIGLYRMSQSVLPVSEYLSNKFITPERRLQIQTVRNKLGIVSNGVNDTFALISSCFDERLIIDNQKCQIVCGVWIWGLLDKSSIKKLIKIVAFEFGNMIVSEMISKFQKVAVAWLSCVGQTMSYTDVCGLDRNIVRADAHDRAEQGEDARMIRDAQHNFVIQSTNMGQNLRTCIESGAKGTMINLGQILACVGQQHSKLGKLEPKMSGNRLFCHDKKEDGTWEPNALEKLERNGYIVSGFSQGLTPREFFIHAITSRDAVVDTATGTAGSGYLQHRIVKWGEDVYRQNGQLIYRGAPGQSKTIDLNYNNGKDPRHAQITQPFHNIITVN